MVEEKYGSIKKLAEDFTSQSFGNSIPEDFCYTTCQPLSLLFEHLQIKHKLTPGKYENLDHFWLTLDDNVTILDPTFRQFETNWIGAYCDHPNKNEITKKYIAEELEWQPLALENAYDDWKKQLANTQEELSRIREMNVITAYVLDKEINKPLDQLPENSKDYFRQISLFLQNKLHNDKGFIERLKQTKPRDFISFLEKLGIK